MLSVARAQGYDAYYLKRKSAVECPYHDIFENAKYVDWMTGWNEAWIDLNEK